MAHTYRLLSEVDTNKVFCEYMIDFVAPGSSMMATAQDVGIFLRVLNDGPLLYDEEQTIYSSVYEYEHIGLLPGYQSIARYHKDMDRYGFCS